MQRGPALAPPLRRGIGVVGRLLLPRPRRAGILLALAAGLVGGEVGVLVVWAAGGRVDYAWVAGVLAAAVAVAGTCGLIAWRNGPYPPHDTTPRAVDPAQRLR
ncbi:MAG TPA: hypothetical protein VGN37_11665 [Actinocatenispora sp.]